MSFGSSGFGGFGQNTNNQQQTTGGFGGFGSNTSTNNTSSFGTPTTGGFGQAQNTGNSLFGGNNSSSNPSFGAAAVGFGASANTGFGSKPAFGATPGAATSGGMFGAPANNTTSSAFGSGGFGSTNNATSSPFGGGASSGGLFNNAGKSTFGATPAAGGSSLFNSSTNNAAGGLRTGGFGTTSGLGGAVGDPPGTGVTPFQAHTEKEPNSTSNQSNSFQNIMFQDPYKKWSAEELRLADYAQGRRHGNASGAGAFGVSSGFGGGGFGSNTQQTTTGFGSAAAGGGNSLFGSNNAASNQPATTSGFGQSGTTGFGGSTTASNGLFGSANKSGGGLFGSAQNTQQPSNSLFPSTGGGAFGSTNTNAGTGFGAQSTANTGGGMFGSNNQAQKPQAGGFSFGNTTNNNTTTGFGSATSNPFGSTTNTATGGGLFGNNGNTQAGGGLFGSGNQPQQQQQQNTGGAFGGGGGGGLFNQQNQNQQQSNGLFGSSQSKPATGGLFGSAGTAGGTGGLFNNANTQPQTTGAFGSTTGTAGNSLFGPAKAATGSSLFGAGNTGQTGTAGNSLFGGLGSNNQNQQSTGGSLFGSMNNAQQPKAGLFGTMGQSTGNGLFGGQNNQTQGSGMFGSSMNQQQQQNPSMGSSLLGNSQQGNNAPQGLTANLNDISAYGNPSLFAGVGGNEVANPGPLATPLNGNSKPRRSSILPMYKLNPASASRFATPQKRGFGFSYSTYSTPGVSPASSISSTPGNLGRSLLGSNGGGSLSKSMSTNNLRRSFNTEDSILQPGAFSASSGSRWYGSTGSKKLVINRDIRSDLFSTPQKDKSAIDFNTGSRKLSKRVSFDTSNVELDNGTPVRAALPAPEDTPKSQTDETPRQNRSTNGANGSKTPESEQVQGKELAIVHEEESSVTPESQPAAGFDSAPGQYWMQPSMEDIQNMNRMQRQKVDGFTVGRDNVGSVSFKVPVDMSGIDLDELCGGIIQLEPRSATVYPVAAKKPPVGKGLNVPARISLEQSWPRGGGRDKRITSDPKRFNKHVDRLKRIPDTTFEGYDKDTGIWTFSVEHFTTYGLDDSDDESEDFAEADQQEAAKDFTESQHTALNASSGSSMEDDTFDFRRHRGLPGAFDEQEEMFEEDFPARQSFLGVSSADSAPNDVRLSLEDQNMGEEYDMSEDEDIARSSTGQHLAAEQDDASPDGGQEAKKGAPGGILRARMRAMKDSAGPVKLEVADGDDWMEMLRKTVSPVKRDRQLLKDLHDSPSRQTGALIDLGKDGDGGDARTSIWRKSTAKTDRMDGLAMSAQVGMDTGRGFATSIDLMNSLFDKPKPVAQSLRASVPSKGFPKWPYERQDKNVAIDEAEQLFHDASRLTWGPNETLVVTRSLSALQSRHSARDVSSILAFQRSGIQTERQDLRLASFSTESSKKYLRMQDRLTKIRLVKDAPMATLQAPGLKDVFHHQDMNNPASIHEKRVWELASILFDKVDSQDSMEPEHTRRKTKLSQFWTDLVSQGSSTAIGLAGSSEEKAVACLGGHRVADACKHLLEGKNFRLSTLVALIGTSDAAKKDMREQLRAWHDSKMLSEFSEAIRTIYELLSGNVGVCEGMKGVPAEDRLDSFVISEKFGLDWRQSFGLRLWYAIGRQDDLATAVWGLKGDIDQDKESLPQPWYLEQGIKPLWDDADADSRQDLLWGLLQLYADENADLEATLRPENAQLSPLDMRLTWQLGIALASTGKVSFGQSGVEKADASTISYASQLTSAGEWLEAIFVLLHLSDATARTKAIQEHLCRHAGQIGPESGSTFSVLTEKFQIPAPWIWEALALYMRSVKKDAAAEVQCLLRAGSFVEAHRVLAHNVAPLAVIERDYASLSSLMAQFEGRQDSIADWALGGEIYSSFLQVLQQRAKGESAAPETLDKLLAGLQAMNEDAPTADVMRYAAVSDMADETAKEILKLARKRQDLDLRSRILALPLTQDRLLAYSVDLSMERYRDVMAR